MEVSILLAVSLLSRASASSSSPFTSADISVTARMTALCMFVRMISSLSFIPFTIPAPPAAGIFLLLPAPLGPPFLFFSFLGGADWDTIPKQQGI